MEHEAIVLRRQMLKNLRVKEFSEEAQFEDPFQSFVIPAVFCPYCNTNRNIDICSDPDVQERVGALFLFYLGFGAPMDLPEL